MTITLSSFGATRAPHRSNLKVLGSLASSEIRHFSHSLQRKKDSNDEDNEPWWSLSSLHKRVATALATSLPESYRSDLHQSLSVSLSKEDSHRSHSISEAIVSAQAREASSKHKSSVKSLKTDEMHLEWLEKQKKLEEDIEKRALEKAKERMQAELISMHEQMKRHEEERLRKAEEERQKLEVELQREIAFKQWKNNVEKEKKQERDEHQPSMESAGLIVENASPDTKNDAKVHPILGQQLANLSYKRIHLMSASTLASLPVYEKQRAYRHDRAQLMAKDKKKTLWMGIPGVISLMEDESGKLAILDGQHRVGMMALLKEEQLKLKEKMELNGISIEEDCQSNDLANLDLQNILVEVFPQRPQDDSVLANDIDLDDKAIIFAEINKAEPIKLLDLPGVATKQTRNIIDYAGEFCRICLRQQYVHLVHCLRFSCNTASHFHDVYPAMFSASQKCRAPHLNLDNLRDALFASEIIKREKIGSGRELVKWMEKKNEELKIKYNENHGQEQTSQNDKEAGTRVNENALKKANKHDLYLGLESTWLYK